MGGTLGRFASTCNRATCNHGSAAASVRRSSSVPAIPRKERATSPRVAVKTMERTPFILLST